MGLDIKIKYILFVIGIGLMQFFSDSILTSVFFIISIFLAIDYKIYFISAKNNISLLLFASLLIFISIVHLIYFIPTNRSLIVWLQFIILLFFPFFISNKQLLLYYIFCLIIFIFTLDFITNILLLSDINIPWANQPDLRINEGFARYPGVKNNNLYSSLISFLSFVISLDKNIIKNKYVRILFSLLSVFNIIVSGSRRFILLAFYILFIRFSNKTLSKRYILIFTFIFFVIVTFYLNTNSISSNFSNALRLELWIHSLNLIIERPFFGYGIFYPELIDVTVDFFTLSKLGVTESFALLVAQCFGIPTLLIFIMYIFKTIYNSCYKKTYTVYLGIFLGFAADFFYAGSFENTIVVTIFFLSSAIINEKNFIFDS